MNHKNWIIPTIIAVCMLFIGIVIGYLTTDCPDYVQEKVICQAPKITTNCPEVPICPDCVCSEVDSEEVWCEEPKCTPESSLNAKIKYAYVECNNGLIKKYECETQQFIGTFFKKK